MSPPVPADSVPAAAEALWTGSGAAWGLGSWEGGAGEGNSAGSGGRGGVYAPGGAAAAAGAAG